MPAASAAERSRKNFLAQGRNGVSEPSIGRMVRKKVCGDQTPEMLGVLSGMVMSRRVGSPVSTGAGAAPPLGPWARAGAAKAAATNAIAGSASADWARFRLGIFPPRS